MTMPDNPPDTPELTPKQEKAIVFMLSEALLETAAMKAGVSERTLRSWRKLPHFKAAYTEARRALMEHAVGRLQWGCQLATHVLLQGLTDDKPAVKMRAACAIIDRALRGAELLDILPHFDELDEAAEARKG
jgi:hypothetical protein